MEWLVRDYHMNDYPHVAQLLMALQAYERQFDSAHLAPDKGFAKNYFSNLMAHLESFDGRILVADQRGKILGFTAGYVVEDHERGETKFHVAELSVLPELRGKGVGADLIRAMEAIALGKHTRISISVMAKSERVHAFYRRLGFEDYTVTLEKML